MYIYKFVYLFLKFQKKFEGGDNKTTFKIQLLNKKSIEYYNCNFIVVWKSGDHHIQEEKLYSKYKYTGYRHLTLSSFPTLSSSKKQKKINTQKRKPLKYKRKNVCTIHGK